MLIHFHLRSAIMIGKKKTNDVQFYSEVGEIAHTVDQRGGWGDRDDLEDEDRERELRKKVNTEFQNFCKKIEELVRSFCFFCF